MESRIPGTRRHDRTARARLLRESAYFVFSERARPFGAPALPESMNGSGDALSSHRWNYIGTPMLKALTFRGYVSSQNAREGRHIY